MIVFTTFHGPQLTSCYSNYLILYARMPIQPMAKAKRIGTVEDSRFCVVLFVLSLSTLCTRPFSNIVLNKIAQCAHLKHYLTLSTSNKFNLSRYNKR